MAGQQRSSFTDTMRSRWVMANLHLPKIDKRDIEVEEPLINGNKILPITSRR